MRRPLMYVGLLVLAWVASARDAHACYNVTQLELDQQTRLVKSADEALSNGDIAKARALLKKGPLYGFSQSTTSTYRQVVGFGNGKDFGAIYEGLLMRSRRIFALTVIRTKTSTSNERTNAVAILRAAMEAKPEPTILADYAEALAGDPESEPLALMILRELAAKDLMGSAFGYAALARLEAARQNDAASTAARERCATMTKRPAIGAVP